MSSNPCDYMVYEVETIKRQAKLRSVGWSWVSLCAQVQPMAYALRWLGLWHDQRLWSSGKRLEALYKCYMPLPFAFAIQLMVPVMYGHSNSIC